MTYLRQATVASLTLVLAGCSTDGGTTGLTTASVTPLATTAKPNPACVTLSQKIAMTRHEGTPGKVYSTATGKTTTVRLKRQSLAKAAELDRLNQEFQIKCSTVPVQRAAVQPQPAIPTAGQPAVRAQTQAERVVIKAKAAAAKSAPKPSVPIVAVPKS